eukprot:CAMPEP_0172377992 /NCGR_PEP_ID=MMETSP1060-20121228/69195_1 /TAXON_ID=37318 /ORGANISM="Pseudo-nitzschia pungens, Strain cf. cingulata" /LENGTH=104 /DNA_ID=CAMNT_0013105703 /DNA_START=667 /DNA_END=982 /DNA_ORIENTATION=-
MDAFDQTVESKIGDKLEDTAIQFQDAYPQPLDELFEGHRDRWVDTSTTMADPEASIPDVVDLIADKDLEFIPDGDKYDEYIGNKVMIQRGDERLKCVVKGGPDL